MGNPQDEYSALLAENGDQWNQDGAELFRQHCIVMRAAIDAALQADDQRENVED